MKRMRGIFAVLLVLVLVFAGACSRKDTQETLPQMGGGMQEETHSGVPEESSTAVQTEPETSTEAEVQTQEETEPDIPFTETNETVWASSNVNIRTAPNTDSEVVGVLKEGQPVLRTGYADGWSRVEYSGRTCYASSDFLTAKQPETTAPVPSGSSGSAAADGVHIVAIDAGHQAHGNSEQEPIGPGAAETKAKVASGTQGVATGVPESQLNLTVSLQLKQELLARGYQVVMIRETQDVNISNAERASIAGASGAEIFLRIHANGSSDPSVNGIVTMCPSSTNPYVSYLYDSSYRLSSLLVNNMCAVTGANNQGVLAVDNMSGINWCTIPVSIIELGYMSNANEDILLNSADYQAKLVQGMANAVDAYFGN